MAAAPSLRIIETTQISPPAGSVPETSIPLTFFDAVWLVFPPVERLFFYPYHDSTSQFAASTLPALKSSLSIALQRFFPLAGTIRPAPGTTEKHEIHYTEGDSISFVAAELDDHYELLGDGPREISKLKILVPQLSKNQSSEDLRPVLAVQVTVFPYHGVVIGITVHHSLCDGNGSVNFMRTWATICHSSNSMTTDAPEQPMLDRSIIPDPDGSLYTTFAKSILRIKDLDVNPDDGEERYYASFKLNHDQIRFLKEKFMHEAQKRNVAVRCSTVVVVYAFIWIGYVKAKSTVSKSEKAHSIFVVDHRRWFQPAIPESYFGNCVGWSCIQANKKDLMDPNGFFEARQTISKAFEAAKKVGINDAKDWVKNALDSIVHNPLSAAGSLRFRVYDVDFGWGKPTKVDIVSIAYSGAMAVAPSREEQGGVEIGLPFTQREMEVFKNYFDESLQEMSALSN